jgi:ABC-2 type transport system ATP-binding protein
MHAILEIQNLSKSFGKLKAVDNLSMTIHAGECVAFMGQNGAGKSTTMRSIAGLSKIDSGKILIAGHDITTSPVEARRHLGFVPQDLALYQYLTADEFLSLVGRIRGLDAEAIQQSIEELLELCDLTEARNRMIREYSGGMARKIAMAGAFVGKPELVVLDESFVGLDPESTWQISEYLKKYVQEGGAVLISSHILDMLHQMCSRFFILHHGQCVADCSRDEIDEMCKNPETPHLTAIYLQKTGRSPLTGKSE